MHSQHSLINTVGEIFSIFEQEWPDPHISTVLILDTTVGVPSGACSLFLFENTSPAVVASY